MTSPADTVPAPRPAALLGLVVLGGSLGAAGRAAFVLPAAEAPLLAVATITLAINVVGSLLLGVVLGRLGSGSPRLRAFLGTGLLGGFTTYSAFAVQLVGLAGAQAPMAVILAVASLSFGVVAALIGLILGRRFAGAPIVDPRDAE